MTCVQLAHAVFARTVQCKSPEGLAIFYSEYIGERRFLQVLSHLPSPLA